MSIQALTREQLVAKLDNILSEGVVLGSPGLSAAISTANGIIWQAAAGSVQTSNVFGIGSITKVFVSVVVLQLVEENKFNLSDLVEDFLQPEIYHNIDNVACATIAQLLGHQAGIDSWEDDPEWISDARGISASVNHVWNRVQPLDYLRRPKSFAPDTFQLYYSNTNFTLLGLIIEEVTSNRVEVEIRRRILDPLGMTDTWMEKYEDSRSEMEPRRYHWATSTFHETAGVNPMFTQVNDNIIDVSCSNLSTEWAAGGIMASASDVLKFAIGLRDGMLLTRESMETMQEWRPITSTLEMGYGLFRLVGPDGKSKWQGHSGGVLGFSGAMGWKEEGDCAVCILSNIGSVHSGDVPTSPSMLLGMSEMLELASELATRDTHGQALV